MTISRIKVPALFHRWHKGDWPRSTGPHHPLRREEARIAEHVAARQEWEGEGGALFAPGPKTPL